MPNQQTDPVKALKRLGGKFSDDLGAYASGRIDASQVRCVLCEHVPCDCPPFGSGEYFALVDRVHGRDL